MTESTEAIQQDTKLTEAHETPIDAEDPGQAGDAQAETEKLVPVSESIRYRKRAQAAEQQVQSLQGELDQIRQSLNETQAQLATAERRQRIDQLLIESEAIDLEAARLLTEAAVAQMDEADVAEVVAELRDRKPYLFRSHQGRSTTGSMGSRPNNGATDTREEAAAVAADSGDRADLIRYLRMRRHP